MRHRLKILHIAAATIVLLALAACGVPLATPGGAGIDFSSRTIQVVATTGHVAEAVRNVGGQRVAVEALMGPGVDPHLYKASAGDVIKIQNADVVMYNGLALEGRMIDIFERLGRTKPTYAIADAIPAELLRAPPEFQGAYDPHVWFDPIRWSYAVDEQRAGCRSWTRTARRPMPPTPRPTAPSCTTSTNTRATDRSDPEIVARADHRARRLRLLRATSTAWRSRGLQGISTASEAGAADVQGLARYIAEREHSCHFRRVERSATADRSGAGGSPGAWQAGCDRRPAVLRRAG